jgi:hypothetical protein
VTGFFGAIIKKGADPLNFSMGPNEARRTSWAKRKGASLYEKAKGLLFFYFLFYVFTIE